MDDKIFLILPGCDDTNRGDQALIWETVSLARDAGYRGSYYMLSEPDQCAQSTAEGISQMNYILRHPSARFKKCDNIHYGLGLKLKWTMSAVLDLLTRAPLTHRWSRAILWPVYSKKLKHTLNLFRHADAAFVKGGGFLHAHGSLSDTYKIYFFLYHIRLAQSFGVPVYVMPNSFGPFYSPLVKGMIRRVLQKCPAVMSRETISQEMLLRDCQVASQAYGDLAFHLQGDSDFNPFHVLEQAGIDCRKEKCVAITARPYRFPGHPNGPERYEAYKTSLATFIFWLSHNGFHPVLVEHVFSDMDHENDMTCIRQLESILDGKCRFSVFSNRNLTCRQMRQIYSTFSYTVGTRFHSVIFSLGTGVPSLAITYGGNKGDGIMKDLGLNQFALPIENLSSDSLIQSFQTLSAHRECTQQQLHAALDAVHAQREQIIRSIRK